MHSCIRTRLHLSSSTKKDGRCTHTGSRVLQYFYHDSRIYDQSLQQKSFKKNINIKQEINCWNIASFEYQLHIFNVFLFFLLITFVLVCGITTVVEYQSASNSTTGNFPLISHSYCICNGCSFWSNNTLLLEYGTFVKFITFVASRY